MSWLETLLRAPIDETPCATLAQWWPSHLAHSRTPGGTIAQAARCGFHADRLAWAFASGYQAALRALVPGLAPEQVVAICVTEAEGNAPRAIRSRLRREGDGYLLDGAKRWTTLGPGVPLLLVAARDPDASTERPLIRLARVPADAPGVTVAPMPPTPFIPEVPHAQPRFENVRVAADAVLPGDGYAQFIKPFRTIEDLHVQAALLAYLVREARRLDGPKTWIERALALLLALEALAALDPLAPATHLTLAGALAQSSGLLAEADAFWAASADPAAARWQRDRALLGVAAQQREQRRERAWSQVT